MPTIQRQWYRRLALTLQARPWQSLPSSVRLSQAGSPLLRILERQHWQDRPQVEMQFLGKLHLPQQAKVERLRGVLAQTKINLLALGLH